MSYFFNHVNDIESLQRLIIQELKEFNIKVPKMRKNNIKLEKTSPNILIFGNDLCNLPRFTTRYDDIDLDVPHFLIEAVAFIRSKIKSEGLFRKAGSVHRQKELKRLLESGGKCEGADVHDVANLVKQFLRQLVNPLVPTKLQELFLKAYDLDGDNSLKIEALQLLCALLPIEHLHVLIYILGFLSDLANNSAYNKMTAHNLAVVMAPNVFVAHNIDKKKHCSVLQKQTCVLQMLIENHGHVGRLPDALLYKAGNKEGLFSINTSEDDLDGCKEADHKPTNREKKKRYSLTGMSSVILGLRRMVQPNQGTSDDLPACTSHLQERGMITPSATKRKHGNKEEENGSSSSKRRALSSKTSNSNSIPAVPVLRFDSPNAAAQNEDLISISPNIESLSGPELMQQKSRKSTRLKFFGKTYLQRRNSITKTPKSASKIKKEIVAVMKKTSSSTENNTIMKQERASPLPKTKPAATSAYNLLKMEKSKSVSEGFHCGFHLAVNALPDSKSNSASSLLINKQECYLEEKVENIPFQQIKTDKVLVEESMASVAIPPVLKTELPKAVKPNELNALKSIDTAKYIKLATKAGLPTAAQSDLLHLTSPSPKKQHTFRRSAYKSSLRRGRPNTVSSGLQLPSPFKCPSERTFKSISSPALVTSISENSFGDDSLFHDSPLLLENQDDMIKPMGPVMRITFDETITAPDSPPPLPKTSPPLLDSVALLPLCDSTDSEVFISEFYTQTSEEDSNGRDFQAAPMSVGDSVEQSLADMTAPTVCEGSRSLTNRRMSISLTNIKSPGEYSDMMTRTKSTNLEMSGGSKPGGLIKWKCATAALAHDADPPDEIAYIGRPSLVRIFKERAGSVSATAKQYDAIFKSTHNTPNCQRTLKEMERSTASPVKIPNVFQHYGSNKDSNCFKTPTTAPLKNATSCKNSQHRTPTRNSSKWTQNELNDSKATPNAKVKTPKAGKVNNNANAKENRSTKITRRLSQKIVEKLSSGTAITICNTNASVKPLTPSKLENQINRLPSGRVIRSKSDRMANRSPKHNLPIKSPSFNAFSKSKVSNRGKASKIPSFGRRQNLSCDKRRSTSM